MGHQERTVKCASCGQIYCEICHPNGCPNCKSVHIGDRVIWR